MTDVTQWIALALTPMWGVLFWLVKLALADRDRRVATLEGRVDVLAREAAHAAAMAAAQGAKLDSLLMLMKQIEKSVERIETKITND